jgi:hypothetical protein
MGAITHLAGAFGFFAVSRVLEELSAEGTEWFLTKFKQALYLRISYIYPQKWEKREVFVSVCLQFG